MNGPVVPFRRLVLKVHSRCDLACDHCYVYEHLDQSWRNRPKVMSARTVAWTATWLAEHAKTHQLDEVRVVLHGGEPLLAGPDQLREVARTLRDALSGVCKLDLRIHTNGVLLDEAYCRVFADEGVQFGVSVDGDEHAHDRHRRYRSYRQVVRALELLRTEPYRHLYAGLLCTIDLANDPVAVSKTLLALDPPQIDFLLPHATGENIPHRPPGGDTAYAAWLLAIFRRWQANGRPVPVRLFDSVISTTLGGVSRTDVGLEPSDLVVVETDGTYEQADSLKTAFDGAPVTGFDLVHHDLDAAARHPGIGARQQGLAGLCDTCQTCPFVTSCGGGLYAHRYQTGSGFANPSVFCADLFTLVTEITHALSPATAVNRPRVATAVISVVRLGINFRNLRGYRSSRPAELTRVSSSSLPSVLLRPSPRLLPQIQVKGSQHRPACTDDRHWFTEALAAMLRLENANAVVAAGGSRLGHYPSGACRQPDRPDVSSRFPLQIGATAGICPLRGMRRTLGADRRLAGYGCTRVCSDAGRRRAESRLSSAPDLRRCTSWTTVTAQVYRSVDTTSLRRALTTAGRLPTASRDAGQSRLTYRTRPGRPYAVRLIAALDHWYPVVRTRIPLSGACLWTAER